MLYNNSVDCNNNDNNNNNNDDNNNDDNTNDDNDYDGNDDNDISNNDSDCYFHYISDKILRILLQDLLLSFLSLILDFLHYINILY